jgi:hypothetical protein
MEDLLKPGIYQHYKGKLYHVMEVGRHSESLDLYVVYRALYGSYALWVRPLELFFEKVNVGGVLKPRFIFLHPCTVAEPDSNRT